jgi:hypothetical protein
MLRVITPTTRSVRGATVEDVDVLDELDDVVDDAVDGVVTRERTTSTLTSTTTAATTSRQRWATLRLPGLGGGIRCSVAEVAGVPSAACSGTRRTKSAAVQSGMTAAADRPAA